MGNIFNSDPASQQSKRNPNTQQPHQRPPRRPLSHNRSTNNTEPSTTERRNPNPERQCDPSIGSNDQKLENVSDPQGQTNPQFSRMPAPPPYEQIFNPNNPPHQPSQLRDNRPFVQNVPTAPHVVTNSQTQQTTAYQVPVMTNNPPIPLVAVPTMPPTTTHEVPKNITSPLPLETNSQRPIAQVSHAMIDTPAIVPVSLGPNIHKQAHKKRKHRVMEYEDDDDDEYSDDYSDYESDHDKNKMYQGYYDHRDYYDKDEDYIYYVTKDGNRYKHYR